MIIIQYRPPVEAFCVEFPAGLIDEGESPEQAAVRELREETGYSGKVSFFNPFRFRNKVPHERHRLTSHRTGQQHQPHSQQPAWHDQR